MQRRRRAGRRYLQSLLASRPVSNFLKDFRGSAENSGVFPNTTVCHPPLTHCMGRKKQKKSMYTSLSLLPDSLYTCPNLIIDGIDIYMSQDKLQDLTAVIKVFWVTLSRLMVHLYFLCVPPNVFCIPDLHVPIGRVTVSPSVWVLPAL